MSKENKQLNIAFVHGGTDEAIIKSMANDEEHEYNSEELNKAMDKAKLVQKEVSVQGKNGQTFTRKQWVRAGEDQSSTKSSKTQEDTKETSSKIKQEEKKEHWTKVGTSQEAKSQIAQMLTSGKSREDCMADFKAQGVTWKEHENQAINWMRAAMAMNKYLTSGAGTSQENEPNGKSEETTSDSKRSSETNSQGEFENGHIDKNGDLVADDESELSDLVSEVTDTDMFDQKDYALSEVEKEYPGATIESMGIEKASQNKDGSVHVTAYVEGYTDDDNFETIVSFDIPAKNKKSMIGSDYTQLTTEKESETIEGEAHNMIVGRLKSMGIKHPTKLDVQQAANDLRDKSIKTIISSYNTDTISRNLALANAFGSISNANKLTVERILKDTLERGSGATREQQCDAISKLCGNNSEYEYESFGDNVSVRASDKNGNPIAVTIEPTVKGLFKVEFIYSDGERSKETYDSIDSVKKATESWIKREEKYTD